MSDHGNSVLTAPTALTALPSTAPSRGPVKFAYWVPNVSGGLVVSKIEQRTHWGIDYNRKLARLAEGSGFEYALSQVRYMASYGAENQHESTSFSLALLLATERLKVIAAVHPGLWHPGVLAKLGATADDLSGGRFAVNVVSGWFKGEFTALGEPWLEHDERYRRSEEFIRALRGIWTEDHFSLRGDFYRINDFTLKPKPVQKPHPEIFQGGNSKAARQMAARVSDWYFMNGNSIEGVRAQVSEIQELAARAGRRVKFGLNAFIIARDTEEEARQVLRDIIAHADVEAVNGFGDAVRQAGRASPEREGMWANSNFEDLVQYNDGFRTGLIGTPEQIARRIVAYQAAGVDLVLGGFLHYLEEVEQFGKKVLPIVRELEADEARKAA
ncbi:dimethylsulfone monooxygenase SfnG [Sorangium sp. So ce185]|uniref:dimethylsulfone monooxygenase SfnG n=1 Tax=Sorangium sp. So ce185 TaxID=3133287 RepID=UPI003F5EF639